MSVRGIPVQPHDIDIMLRLESVPAVSAMLADVIVEPIIPADDWMMKYFGVAFLGARVDLAFDAKAIVDDPQPSDFGPYAASHLETVAWRGCGIRVPPLGLHLASNKRRGRDDRVGLIEERLALSQLPQPTK